MRTRTGLAFLLAAALSSTAVSGQVIASAAIPNWPAPATWSPARETGARTLAIPGPAGPFAFVAIPPCRLVDTRGTVGVPINTGGKFTANEGRGWKFTGLCGIPGSGILPVAFSLNITVTNTEAHPFGFLTIYPLGGIPPSVSTLNWSAAGLTVANAAIVESGRTTEAGFVGVTTGNAGADVIVDVNGYYAVGIAGGGKFQIITDGAPAIYGISNAVNGIGVSGQGQFEGVTGLALDADAGGAGVAGAVSPKLGVSGPTYGVKGFAFGSETAAAGVYGLATSSSGVTFGVLGQTSSTAVRAAGVNGIDGSGDPGTSDMTFSAGVRGGSSAGYGVYGASKSAGVKGSLLDSLGNPLTAGFLGFNSTDGVHAVGNVSATGTKPFIEPHPYDATKEIAYVALEGPEAGTYFRGRGRIHNGTGVVVVPESFRLVTDDDGLTVQITPIGQAANVAVVSADLGSVVVRSSVKDLEFYYVVNGVRRAFKDWSPIAENRHYVPEGPNARMPGAFSPEQRRTLIANGTYNEDGTVNRETAERLGWARAWAAQEAAARAAAEEAHKAALEHK